MSRYRLIFCILLSVLLSVLCVHAAPVSHGMVSADDHVPEEAVITLKMVQDINWGTSSSTPAHMAVYNGDLYFNAQNSSSLGLELWKYNTTSGASLVRDLYAGSSGSSPQYLTDYNGVLYFSADGGDGKGRELWRYSPSGGFERVTDTLVAGPGNLTVYNDWLYFSADANDGNGTELWRYSPVYGAQPVADIYAGTNSSSPGFMAVYNGALYFGATGSVTDSVSPELWTYTPAKGASRVEDIYPVDESMLAYGPKFLAVYNGALYFAMFTTLDGRELWKYDTAGGAQRVADISQGSWNSNPEYLTVYNGALYFSANGGDNAGIELWKYDPVNGPVRVTDLYPGVTDSQPLSLTVYNGALYFSANGNNNAGRELWVYSNSAGSSFRSVRGADGWVLESGENTNAGGTVNAGAATFNLGDDAADRQYRSILSFDTSSLPDTAVVTKLFLKIRRESLAGTNHFATLGNIKVDIRNGSFSGNATLQPGDFQAAASKTAIGTITSQADANNWYTGALTSASYSSVNRKGVTQIRLRFATDDNNDNGADYLRFFSGNTALFSNRPELQVTYYTP